MLQKNYFFNSFFSTRCFIFFHQLFLRQLFIIRNSFFVNIFGKVLETDRFVKKLLQYSIIGLGFRINLNTAIEAGSQGFLFLPFLRLLWS